MSRIFTTSFASVYPHYVTKVEKKGRTKAELDQVIEWLTGFDESTLSDHLAAGATFEGFFTVYPSQQRPGYRPGTAQPVARPGFGAAAGDRSGSPPANVRTGPGGVPGPSKRTLTPARPAPHTQPGP